MQRVGHHLQAVRTAEATETLEVQQQRVRLLPSATGEVPRAQAVELVVRHLRRHAPREDDGRCLRRPVVSLSVQLVQGHCRCS